MFPDTHLYVPASWHFVALKLITWDTGSTEALVTHSESPPGRLLVTLANVPAEWLSTSARPHRRGGPLEAFTWLARSSGSLVVS